MSKPESPSPGPLQRPRLYEQLADHIAAFIDAQGLSPGDRLPPERRLAAELGVSRATLSRALVALEVQGRVEVQHGNGAVVRDPNAVAWPFESRDPDSIARAREAVMAGLAREAAAHPDRSLRIALLGPDGRKPQLAEVWRCVRRLAGASLLAELDDILAPATVSPDTPLQRERAAALAKAIVAGNGQLASTVCHRMLTGEPA